MSGGVKLENTQLLSFMQHCVPLAGRDLLEHLGKSDMHVTQSNTKGYHTKGQHTQGQKSQHTRKLANSKASILESCWHTQRLKAYSVMFVTTLSNASYLTHNTPDNSSVSKSKKYIFHSKSNVWGLGKDMHSCMQVQYLGRPGTL